MKKWLGGIEPAWTLLDRDSFQALYEEPSPTGGPIRLASDLTQDELQGSAVSRNALLLLRAAAMEPGLKLTATGNLSRGVVAEMCERFTWPGYDRHEAFRFHKVVNEPDFFPLYFVRHIVQAGQFVREHKGRLTITPSGRQMLDMKRQQTLQAVLFHIAFWHLDLGYLGRGLQGDWPQSDVGIILWSLSVTARDWETPERLTRMCTIPISSLLDSAWDVASHAMEAKILRPLRWFGLLEHRQEDVPEHQFAKRHFYRKAPLFDRFLSFTAKVESAEIVRH